MKFGIQFPIAPSGLPGCHEPSFLLRAAQAAEELGFESIWTGDHTSITVGYDCNYPYAPDGRMIIDDDACWPEPFTWLGFLSGVTKTIKLATGVLILPQRQPVLVAKQAATVDQLSLGRLLLGVGVGWQREESEALGVPFAGRGARTDEYIVALRTIWAEDTASFSGTYVKFERLKSQPKPAQSQGPPIIIGGHSDAAARRAGRLGDGLFLVGSPEEVDRLRRIMSDEAALHGRDAGSVELTVGFNNQLSRILGMRQLDAVGSPDGVLDEVKRFADVGVSRMVEFRVHEYDIDELIAFMRAFSDAVISKV